MKKYYLYFYCNANEIEGLGHFIRCYYLASLLKRKNIKIIFVGRFNELAIKILKKNRINYIENDLNFFTTSIPHADLLVLDSYLLKKSEIRVLTKLYKVLIIDDFNDRSLYNALAVLNFTINSSEFDYNKIPFKLLGVQYFPYSKDFYKIRSRNLRIKQGLTKENLFILTTFGGTHIDENKILQLIGLLDNFFINSVICLIHKYPLQFKSTKNKFIHVSYTDRISAYYRKANLVVTGGGLAKYESAFCAIPNLTISINQGQHNETKNFQKKNLTWCIGTFYNFNIMTIKRKINQFFENNSRLDLFYESSKVVFKTNELKKDIYKILKYE